MRQVFDDILIEGIASCVPANKVGNERFEELLTPKEIKMFEKTVGIRERRWADEGVTASDLGFAAAEDLFASGKFDKKDIKGLVFLSQTSDFKIPFTSNILQARLGLSSDVMCLDINAGCAGFVQGLSTAFSMAASAEGSKILLVISETLSKILSLQDRSTAMIFGDGASAIIVSKQAGSGFKSYFNFFSDGSNFEAIQIPDGGYRNTPTPESLVVTERENGSFRHNLHLKMDGPKVFDFTLREIAPGLRDLLTHFGIVQDSIDYFIFHQSNQFIISQIASQLGIDRAKVPVNISAFGNTSGVSLPLVITTENQSFKGRKTRLLCSGYGSGLNWGNVVFDLSPDVVLRDLIEY